MSVYLTEFREFYICTACKNVVRDEKGCCPHCGDTATKVRVVGRALVECSPPPACPVERILAFYPKGEEPKNLSEIVKKHQRSDWALWGLVTMLFVAGFICGSVASIVFRLP